MEGSILYINLTVRWRIGSCILTYHINIRYPWHQIPMTSDTHDIRYMPLLSVIILSTPLNETSWVGWNLKHLLVLFFSYFLPFGAFLSFKLNRQVWCPRYRCLIVFWLYSSDRSFSISVLGLIFIHVFNLFLQVN